MYAVFKFGCKYPEFQKSFTNKQISSLITVQPFLIKLKLNPLGPGALDPSQPITTAEISSSVVSLPFGQVPAFEDGDIKIFESRAITKYIGYNYENQGTQLIYKTGKELAAFSTWVEVEAHQFDPVASKLAWELVYKSKFGMETDKSVVEENEAKLAKILDVYEARLSQSKYLGGGSFSLADLNHLPVLHYLMGTQVKKVFDERPCVGAWVKDILARPAWVKATKEG